MKSLGYHESKQRGSQEFPLDYHYIDREHPRYEMPYHWHEETEILHVISGDFSLMLDGEPLHLTTGDIAYIASGRLHGGEPQESIYECVVFDMRLMMKYVPSARTFIHDVNGRKVDVLPHFLAGSDMGSCLIPMFDALREGADGGDLIANGALMQFLGEVKRSRAYTLNAAPKDRESRNVLKLKRVFEMIESSPSNPPSLSELSGAIGMSPKYFCRFFREATHYTPVEYIGFYRIEQACYEMAATEKNVTEIALDLGYCDLSHFIRCFKKYKDISPGEYLKTIRNKGE